LDLDGRDADAVALLEHLIVGHRLAVDADEVVLRPAMRQTLPEELGDVDAWLDIDVVGESATMIVDEENPHRWFSLRVKVREANKEWRLLRREGELPVDGLFAKGGKRALLGLDVGNFRRRTEPVAADLLPQVGDGYEVHLIRRDVGDAKNHR